ncbi:tRNA-2-methylthio-N(6)-dimethylallyladenosine synthase [uncultured archaeon]|nr:tRNA-2-methylthio-N(6)-dimethylallyladenosine synthase [uncultured archaeon]
MKFYIETYGCTANHGNSQDVATLLQELGHKPSALNEADAVIVNTCIVTAKTQRKILHRLRQLEGKRLVVAGCMSAAIPQSIQSIECLEIPGLLDKAAAATIASHFGAAASSGNCETADLRQEPRSDLCAIVNIAEGCNGTCSYCIVRNARGRLVSLDSDVVAKKVQSLAGQGNVELQLSAQDTAAYGLDRGTNLARLLERVANIPGNFMLRVGMMNPDNVLLILDDLILAFDSPKIYRFLHLPLQSGSNEILRSMGRRYSAQDFLEIANAFRGAFPDITIITDVIAGYPGETEENFLETLDIVKRLQPDKVNVTRFSSRPGTPASRLYDMPDRFKKDRSREMTSVWLNIAAQRNKRYVGEVLSALVTEHGRGASMKARAPSYQGIVVQGNPLLGSFIKVKVTASNPFFLSGKIEPE